MLEALATMDAEVLVALRELQTLVLGVQLVELLMVLRHLLVLYRQPPLLQPKHHLGHDLLLFVPHLHLVLPLLTLQRLTRKLLVSVSDLEEVPC